MLEALIGGKDGKKRYTAEESVLKMREIDIMISQGKSAPEACKATTVSTNVMVIEL